MTNESLVVLREPRVATMFAKPQFVMDRIVVDDIVGALHSGDVVRRDIAERRPSLKQAVAYTSLRSGNGLLCLRRGKKVGSELRGRWTVVFGGHVNGDERDGLAGLRRCVLRELREEFGHLKIGEPDFKGIVADPTSEVGIRHLGFMFEARVRESSVCLDRSFDNHEYSLIRGKGYFSDIDDLLRVDRRRFDPWSQLVLGAYRRSA